MLESCSTLLECESILIPVANEVDLLGEIPLSSADVETIKSLVVRTLAKDIPGGTRYLKRYAPTCFALFLVWMGITGYNNGNYWGEIGEVVGCQLDANWQRQWGRFFLSFLEKRVPSRLAIDSINTYVTSILFHGGIPNSCLDTYFEFVILPFVAKEKTSAFDVGKARQALTFFRQDLERRHQLEQERQELRGALERLKERKTELERASSQIDIELDAPQPGQMTDALQLSLNLPADLEQYLQQADGKDRELGRQVDQLTKHLDAQESAPLTLERQAILDRADQIQYTITLLETAQAHLSRLADLQPETERLVTQRSAYWQHLSAEAAWSDAYAKIFVDLPIDRLQQLLLQRDELAAHYSEARSRLVTYEESTRRWLHSWLPILSVLLLLGATWVINRWSVTDVPGALLGVLGSTVAVLLWIGWIWKWTHYRRRAHHRLLENATTIGQDLAQIDAQLRAILSPLPIDGPWNYSVSNVLERIASLSRRINQLQETQRELHATVEEAYRTAYQVVDELNLPEPGTTIAALRQLLQGELIAAMAEEAQKKAERQRTLDRLRQQIEAVVQEKQVLAEQLKEVKAFLKVTGRGDIQSGPRRSVDMLRSESCSLTNEGDKAPDLPFDETVRERAQSEDTELSEDEQRALIECEREIAACHTQLKRIEEEIATYPQPLSAADEPIRRYLLYGGDSATKFWISTIKLLHQALTDPVGRLPQQPDDLPERVYTAFVQWWSAYQEKQTDSNSKEDSSVALAERFRTPTIMLDAASVNVELHLPPQRFSIDHTQPVLVIAGETAADRRKTYKLRSYRYPGDLQETEELHLPLPFPANMYDIRLETPNSTLRKWTIIATSQDHPYWLFDGESGKLLAPDAPIPSQVWLMARKGQRVLPTPYILERLDLYGDWKAFSVYRIDLNDDADIYLVDDQGNWHSIYANQQRSVSVALVGVEPLHDIESDGADIYVGEPPHLRVPIATDEELRLWRISVQSLDNASWAEAQEQKLSELVDASATHAEKHWVDLHLDHPRLLGRQPIGRYRVRLRKPPYQDWEQVICVLPYLKIFFDKNVYLPHLPEENVQARVGVQVPSKASFAPLPPAYLIKTTDNLIGCGIAVQEDVLRGTLRLNRGLYQVPLAIVIPKICWRLQGSENPYDTWQHTVEEVWWGELESSTELFLAIALPPSILGRVTVSLGEGDTVREETVPIRSGMASVDLLSFSEVLHSTNASLQTVYLTVLDTEWAIQKEPLFRFRTRWEADNIQCIQSTHGHVTTLAVSWHEKGKPDTKVLRLWSAGTSEHQPVLEEVVASDACDHQLRFSLSDVPPGRYLLQLDSVDPWFTGIIHRPSADSINTCAVEVVPTASLRQGERFVITAVADDESKLHEPAERYEIEIRGKIAHRNLPEDLSLSEDVLITTTNEGWYLGYLTVPNNPMLTQDANPVKVDYRAEQDIVTAIEDRYGEGPLFCTECRRLHWRRKPIEEEEQRGHRQYLCGPVEHFQIRWCES